MFTNADITIFNQYADLGEKKIVYIPHYIEHVWFHTDQKSSVSDGGITSADDYKIRIPFAECVGWMPPDEYASLPSSGAGWTVQNGDLFIRGKWDGGRVYGIEDIRKGFSGIIGKVLSHSENFFGSQKHIRIGGGT